MSMNKTKKIGRNQLCPCGSGNKHKHCHGHPSGKPPFTPPDLQAKIEKHLELVKSKEHQRIQQQGLGSPVNSWELEGVRYVRVGGRLLWSSQWRTFHDFLVSYLVDVLGKEWFTEQQALIKEEQHEIIQWFEKTNEFWSGKRNDSGSIKEEMPTGAVYAYLDLSYHLYLIAHNVSVQSLLIKRIKNKEQFRGALFETLVVSTFIKAGFEVEFEDETDGSVTHTEFTATFKQTGRSFTVEAKSREPFKQNFHIYNQLRNALSKSSTLERLVFIQMNVPNVVDENGKLSWVEFITNDWFRMEKNLTLPGNIDVPSEPPPAIVFLINKPYFDYLDSSEYSHSATFSGFKIEGLQLGYHFDRLLHFVEKREEYKEIYELWNAYEKFQKTPITFDGSNPAFINEKSSHRLIIGECYELPDKNGQLIVGELIEAIVAYDCAICTLSGVDGTTFLAKAPLNKTELKAYNEHPETFFGKIQKNRGQITDASGWYDFFWETYQHSDRKLLIERLKSGYDLQLLESFSQDKLASLYCEAMASHAVRADTK